MRLSFERYKEINLQIERPNLKPYDTATVYMYQEYNTYRPSGYENGYIVIPDELPLDYTNKIYWELDTSNVNGLTFGGYLTKKDGKYIVLYLDAQPELFDKPLSTDEQQIVDEIKTKCVRAIGFDDNHLYFNSMSAEDGANDIAKQLKKMIEVGK